jgi:hypothetical protein
LCGDGGGIGRRTPCAESWPPRFRAPDLVVATCCATIAFSSGSLAEEVLARVRAALGLESSGTAPSTALFHDATQQTPWLSLASKWIPARAPQHLDDVPAGTEEGCLELLDDLAVAAHRAVEPLQVAVDDEHEIVELLARRHGVSAPIDSVLVHLAVAEEGPDLADRRGGTRPRCSR